MTTANATPTIFNPAHLHDPTPNGYSTAVITPGMGRLAFVSGQGGQDQTGSLSSDFGEQVAQAYASLGAVLNALGGRPEHVVKLTAFVVDHDMAKLDVLTENVTRMFGATLPAQTLVPVPKLAVDGMLFEVEAIVAVD
jgi:enamine deaminase RidA (YjgF/YER057c/UK114 family)